ncbi:MAG: ChrB domain-containing protein [Streptosporangiales bacterium]|jgi:hypothetical protein|nr:ChrB domain-containing protein [Streptosporangiales bacterium]
MSTAPGWLLFLAQLPRAPSSARVALWRKLRASGAAGIMNGAWVLPDTEAHARLLEQLRETVTAKGGKGAVLAVPEPGPGTEELIMECIRADRDREYDELEERCGAFLAELAKESRAGKFIFAELEENEQELAKLARWLAKIVARDFFPGERRARAEEMLGQCRDALRAFSGKVYEAEDPE